MHVLAISGSLRASSSNTALVRAAALIAPPGTTLTIYEGLGTLPHFNPDLDAEGSVPPMPVVSLRAQVARADALLISTPEYAHGVPGSLKNALDWLVSAFELPGIAVALINPSQQSVHANAALREILTTMAARVIPDASGRIPILNRRMDAVAMANDPAIGPALRAALAALEAAVAGTRYVSDAAIVTAEAPPPLPDSLG